MSDLGELYAACIVEYSRRQPGGVLTGDSSVFVKDARDAFDLPYDEDLFNEAFQVLERMRVLTRYQHKGVATRYAVRASSFENAMIVEGNGRRRYESFVGNSAASLVAATSAALLGEVRKPTLLESYADLKSDYLAELLGAFEPDLAEIGQEDDGNDIIDEATDGLIDAVSAPASNRIVTLNDNQAEELETASEKVLAALSLENAIEGNAQLRARFIGQLKAGRELIRSKVIQAHLLYQTLMTILGQLIEKYKGSAIGETAKQLWALLLKHIFT